MKKVKVNVYDALKPRYKNFRVAAIGLADIPQDLWEKYTANETVSAQTFLNPEQMAILGLKNDGLIWLEQL